MIIVKFKGGLGNQMFQYANYIALQQRYPKTPVYADISQYNISKFHNGLEIENVFGIKLNSVLGMRGKPSIIKRYFFGSLSIVLTRLFKSNLFNNYKYIEDDNEFKSELATLDINVNYLLEGYWGNEYYFCDSENLVREKFTFINELNESNQSILKRIKEVNSVSVHIRRGDYLTTGSSFVDLCSGTYYQKSFHYFINEIDPPVFFIFTDDVPWCKKNLGWLSDYNHFFVEGNHGNNSFVDLRLMKECQYNIIANSTFSWWGAWLNDYPDKKVLCPQRLFHDKIMNDKIVAEFYPIDWIKI